MYKIAVLPGDGIGPEIVAAAVTVLQRAATKYGFFVELAEAPIGGAAIDATGTPLPERTISLCQNAHAVLLGAVGGPQWDNRSDGIRPEQGLLKLRADLHLFANLRPAVVYPALRSASPLKDDILGDGLDLMVVRELTGGIYFGERGRRQEGDEVIAYDTESYAASEIRRIAEVAFTMASLRSGRLCSVDKANVLESSRLWREIMIEVALSYPQVTLSHLYVDNAAMQLVRAPRQFDVIVTSNMFGDILSDEASQITGSIGMLASASVGSGDLGLYEPIHGSAPDIAGQDVANPLATILSVAMMLRYSLHEAAAADGIEHAVEEVLAAGYHTADIAQPDGEPIGTAEMGRRVAESL